MKMIVEPNGVSAARGHLALSYQSDKYTQEYVVPDTMGPLITTGQTGKDTLVVLLPQERH